jgi:hypothetical protein
MLARVAYSFAEQTIKLPLGNAVTFARTVASLSWIIRGGIMLAIVGLVYKVQKERPEGEPGGH